MSKVISSVLAMIAASFLLHYWKDYQKQGSCVTHVAELKSAYENGRPRGGYAQVEDAISRAAALCDGGSYEEAQRVMLKGATTCVVNKGCNELRKSKRSS